MPHKKGELSAEGKTKKIWKVVGDDGLVVVEQKDAITAHDDPEFTKQFAAKAGYSNSTTCRVFELLQRARIPVAYQQQISSTEFLAQQCTMIPLEVIARRFAVGSFLKRHPELTPEEGSPPHRFHRLVTEFFLKTTGGQLIGLDGKVLVKGLDPKKKEEDPFIPNPYDENWKLFHSKKPAWHSKVDLGKRIKASLVIHDDFQGKIREMENILKEVFLVLEGAWNTLGLRFIDLKIEFGISVSSGNLLVADVIDNDSWRLRDAEWEELSKEVFRQGGELGEVERKYGVVASLVEQFRVPEQALVIWRGSPNDEFPKVDIPLGDCGVDIVEVTLSGHKSPRMCLDRIEKILGDFPDGGVIVAKVGRSNGLGPMLAARTSWPVIAIPATMENNPEDVWSSVRMPSSVPLATVWPDGNAVPMALNILASKNPVLYMWRQKQVEELDI